MTEVIGTNTSGVGVSGTGSTYGVYGKSTGRTAGIVGANGANATGPGIYAQTASPAPGLFAISGLALTLDTLFGTDLDTAAANWGAKFPGSAAVFIGNAAITGALVVGTTPVANASSGSVHATTGAFSTGAFSNGVTAQNGGAFPAVAVSASSANGHGVYGVNQKGAGSGAAPKFGCGIWGESDQGYGVYGASVSYSGVYGRSTSGLAGEFDGNVKVSGDLNVSGSVAGKTATFSGAVQASDVMLSGADCAEEFDAANAKQLEPGTVVVFNDVAALIECTEAYSKRAAGVISGAGDYQPGVILDRRPCSHGRAAVALVGKVFCKVDATYSPIEIGDLLTTSSSPGCAMKAVDPTRATGAVIGKALVSLNDGVGMIPILVMLR